VTVENALTLAAFLALLLSGAATLLLSTRFEARPQALALLNLGALALSALCFALTLTSTGTLYGMVSVGGLTSYAGLVLCLIGALTILGVMADPHKYEAGTGEIYALVVYTVLGGVVMVGANNLLLFYLGLELSAYSTYVLVGYYRDDAYSTEAAGKYFTLGALASALLLYGLSLVFGSSDSVFYADILANLSAAATIPPLLWPGLALLLVGFSFKLALVPFHAWTPDAYQGAPTMAAALLSAGPKAAVSIALGGLMLQAFAVPAVLAALQSALVWLAILTMSVGNLQALNQSNLKRLLGYSSVAQLGYVAVGLAAVTPEGLQAVMFYVLAYALANLGAFTAISVLRGRGVGEELDAYRGLGRRQPQVALLFTLFLLSLAGVPLLAGFAAKLFVFGSAVNAGLYLLAAVAIFNTVLAYFYYLRVIVRMYLDAPAEGATGRLEVGGMALTALALAAVGVVVLGVFPGLALGPAAEALAALQAPASGWTAR
jgi:NADH-quinone oxidoreductase subunit N